jgi:mannose-6-phosphate isomerase-like protein (cupin superfamily)
MGKGREAMITDDLEKVTTVYPTIKDIEMFHQETADDYVLEVEHFIHDAYLDKMISKPWGHEYRIFADNFYDVWKLLIGKHEKTSMHCHPRKETMLLCLAGKGKVTFLTKEIIVEEGDYVLIGKGVFHSTENIGDTELELIEVETPRNKFDLIRVADQYGRKNTKYESEGMEYPYFPTLYQMNNMKSAKLRPHDVNKKYAFSMSYSITGAIIGHDLLFVISLGIENAINQKIHVINSDFEEFAQESSQGCFLIISKQI